MSGGSHKPRHLCQVIDAKVSLRVHSLMLTNMSVGIPIAVPTTKGAVIAVINHQIATERGA